MSIHWCVTCVMSSTSLHVCWTAITSSVPAAYEAGPMTAVSAAPSVGKTYNCEVDEDQFMLHTLYMISLGSEGHVKVCHFWTS